MQSFGTKIGVAVGMVTSVLLAIPMIKLLLGDCYFEQGCGAYENLKVIAALICAAGAGAFAGWLASQLIRIIGKAGHRGR